MRLKDERDHVQKYTGPFFGRIPGLFGHAQMMKEATSAMQGTLPLPASSCMLMRSAASVRKKKAPSRMLLLRFHTRKKNQMRDQSGNVDTPDYFEEDQADVGGAGVCLGKHYAHV